MYLPTLPYRPYRLPTPNRLQLLMTLIASTIHSLVNLGYHLQSILCCGWYLSNTYEIIVLAPIISDDLYHHKRIYNDKPSFENGQHTTYLWWWLENDWLLFYQHYWDVSGLIMLVMVYSIFYSFHEVYKPTNIPSGNLT